MPSRDRITERPRDWSPKGEWPRTPFRRPTQYESKYDIVDVEQLANICLCIEDAFRRGQWTSVEQLAGWVGTSKSTISSLRTGDTWPSLHLLLRVCAALGWALFPVVWSPEEGPPVYERQVASRVSTPASRAQPDEAG